MTKSHWPTTSTSVPTAPGPSMSAPSTPSTSRVRPSRTDVTSVLPILGVLSTRRINLQTLLLLLQDTVLGLLNHLIQIQNQSNESIFRVLGHPPPPPIPTFQHPYHCSSYSTCSLLDPPVDSTLAPAPSSVPASGITPEALFATLAGVGDPSVPSLPAVVELVSGIATPSGTTDGSEDTPVGRVTPSLLPLVHLPV